MRITGDNCTGITEISAYVNGHVPQNYFSI